jgi:serine/threonine protein kinase
MEKYALKERLGEGSYGVVWRAMRGDRAYAVKIINGVNAFRKDEVESEIAIMMKLSHPNLVKIY